MFWEGWRLAAGWTVCGSNPGEDKIFRAISDGCLSGVKELGRGIDYPLPSNAEGKERVQQCHYSPPEQGRIKLFGAPRQ